MDTHVQSWAQKFREHSDSDATIQSMGKYFTCTYMLDMETAKVIVDMRDGKVNDINVNPAPLDSYQFAFRASAATWKKFGMETPPPMFHGIWAASFREDLKMEGDLLVLMQNLRNITIQIELLRKTGVPV
ncbi:hypothetical protein G7017_22720 [Pseudomonas fulva]|uniref:hypothetical protein n=1 Tax=Pseudomonas TaxID=286 RepID=UPI0001FB9368|nr:MULTISPECIES: hypothetical protein [Pseudomonas]AXQ48192.1 hypothetical protein DZC31_13515 [Stenotrophomonas rhizophila]PPB16885.1 hypothetical protein HV87_20485 [Pseudomonas aeruginosa]AGN82531.1 hypothetical protein L483_16680 [Pseudomonas putida H8234]EGC00339.1 hypothetical protein G1E_03662 [Pseudomonas sp. TJI-51]MBA1219196.1 hypothetical protein [Pseudomonas fulva]